MTLRREGWSGWFIGLVFGTGAGLMVLLGGAPFLFLGLAFLALASIAARSLAFLSGLFIGVGGTWVALAVRSQLACDAFDAGPHQGCSGFGVGQFVALSAAILGIGVLLGIAAWRRAARAGSPAQGAVAGRSD